jgi:phage/plasmid primase-like uncharacterized protein
MTALTPTVADAKAIPIEHWLASAGHHLKRYGREFVGPCPVCGGTDRFAVNVGKQLWNCRGCAKGGDLIALVQHIDGVDFLTAFETLTGNTVAQRRVANLRLFSPQTPSDDERRGLEYAGRIWDQTSELTPEAVAYFANRKIDITAVPNHGGLRFHARCPWENGTKPCIIGQYTTAISSEPRGIWRRPIDGGKPKAIGPTAGCVIRLWPNDAVEQGLVIGEGVETTLAASSIQYKRALLQPAWATGSAGNMAKFPVLSGIDALTILVDNDSSGTGERAATECAKRWQGADREVVCLLPHREAK